MTIGTIWADRETGEKCKVEAVSDDGRVQLSPVAGGNYRIMSRIMSEKSLRSNYQLVAMKEEPPAPAAPAQPAKEKKVKKALPAPQGDKSPRQKPVPGRVQMPDGSVIAGSRFIIEVCGKKRDETYRVDSPIRWLLKPDGQAMLKEKGATIVYGQQITKK